MNQLTLDLPPHFAPEEELRLLGVRLYELERVSIGKAAEFAGLLRAFIDVPGRQEIPIIRHDPKNLTREVECWWVASPSSLRA